MSGRRLAALLALWAAAAAQAPAESWKLRFFHDELDSTFAIADFRFSPGALGLAVGALVENDKARPHALVTRDGGKTWSLVKLPDDAVSVFLLDDSHAWLVTDGGIHFSKDGGRRWDRISKLKNVARVHFLDARRGFAAGAPKKVWRTENGGKDWEEVAEAGEVKSDPERTAYHWLDFFTPMSGMILGFHEPERGSWRDFPDWMDPESARQRRQLPTLSHMLRTTDGGKTWQASTSSIFGRITRTLMFPDGKTAVLVEFQYTFDHPSEILMYDPGANTTSTWYQAKDRAITDLAKGPDGAVYAAGFEPSGVLSRLPIPGRVVVLRNRSSSLWKEMEVDYRVVANRVWLARSPGGGMWAATNTGMLLELTPE